MFSCIEHKKTQEDVACLVALSTQTLENVAFLVTQNTKPLENEAERETPRKDFLISQLDNSDFGKCWAEYLNSKIPPQLFFEICHLKFN